MGVLVPGQLNFKMLSKWNYRPSAAIRPFKVLGKKWRKWRKESKLALLVCGGDIR